jgi:hypothetical protein
VIEDDKSSPEWHYYAMRNGRIIHGRQYPEGEKRFQPTSYYGTTSGIGLLMLQDRRPVGSVSPDHPLSVGIVGLGPGTIAAYGRPGDYIRYYEINPDVISAATDAYPWSVNYEAAITNGYLDLKPVIWKLAQHFNLQVAWVHDVATSRMCRNSDWVLLARNDNVLGQGEIAARVRSMDSERNVRLWTDDYSNLLQVLRR